MQTLRCVHLRPASGSFRRSPLNFLNSHWPLLFQLEGLTSELQGIWLSPQTPRVGVTDFAQPHLDSPRVLRSEGGASCLRRKHLTHWALPSLKVLSSYLKQRRAGQIPKEKEGKRDAPNGKMLMKNIERAIFSCYCEHINNWVGTRIRTKNNVVSQRLIRGSTSYSNTEVCLHSFSSIAGNSFIVIVGHWHLPQVIK